MQVFSVKNLEFSQKKLKFPQPVLIKGFRGEPTKLNCLNIDNFFATVVGKSGKTQMKLKVKYVFHYDEDTHEKLQKAFNSGDGELLAQEWQRAEPVVSPIH